MNASLKKRDQLMAELKGLRHEVSRLQKVIAEQDGVVEKLKVSEKKYRSYFDNAQVAMFRTRISDGKLLEANPQFVKMFGYKSRKEALATSTALNRYENLRDREPLLAIMRKHGKVNEYELQIRRKDGTVRWISLWAQIYPTEGYIEAINTDITERKLLDIALEKKEKELEIQAKKLEEMNAALSVLVSHTEQKAREKVDDMIATLKILVLPFLEKLKRTRLDKIQEAFLEVVESNLSKIFSPFARRLSSWDEILSPTELQVAALIKEGKTSKEIAELLRISPDTVSFHRKNIRSKLGIVNKKINLKTFLLSVNAE